LIYSSYRSRGLEYKQTPHIDRKKRQRSKDYEPQKRVTFVLEKPIQRISKILSKGQCQVLRTTAAGSGDASLKKAPAVSAGAKFWCEGVLKTPKCSVPNVCEDSQ